MIDWDKRIFEACGFKYESTFNEKMHYLHYEGDILKYLLIIGEEDGLVSISGDTKEPFSSESMYEIYAPCKYIVHKSSNEVDYRRFQFLFYIDESRTQESLRLTVAGRLSDNELVVWPYLHNQ